MTSHTQPTTPRTTRVPSAHTPSNRGTFASLRLRNYRLFFIGMTLSNTGGWMSRVALDWLVLVILTDHSATALGLAGALAFLPIPLLAPLAGALADRVPKRTLLLATQSGQAVVSFGLAALVFSGHIQLWMVYLLGLLQGTLAALDNPARQAFVSEMVPPQFLANAVGLNSTSFNVARMLGPALAGLSIAVWGVGPAILFNAVSFSAVLVALRLMDASQLAPAPRRTGRGSAREGFAYVRSRPDIMLIMFLVFMLGTFGMNFSISTALMATRVYGVGPEGYGVLGSVMAIGSLGGALLAARRARPRFRTIILALTGFAVFVTAAALSPSYGLFAILLIPVGFSALTAMTTANSSVQLSTEPGMRGRVMALYLAIFMGGTPLGAPFVGWVGDAMGPRWTLLVGSIAVGLAVAVALVYSVRSGRWTPTLRRPTTVEPTPLDPED